MQRIKNCLGEIIFLELLHFNSKECRSFFLICLILTNIKANSAFYKKKTLNNFRFNVFKILSVNNMEV